VQIKGKKMNEENREMVKFKLESENPKSSLGQINTANMSIKKESTTATSLDASKPTSGSATNPNNNNNNNDEAERRIRAETVKKNWKIVLDMAIKKRNDTDFYDRSESVALNMSSFNSSQPQSHEIYASEKENWIYFSIIIATVVFLSILFCYLVYSFFPSFRAQNF